MGEVVIEVTREREVAGSNPTGLAHDFTRNTARARERLRLA